MIKDVGRDEMARAAVAEAAVAIATNSGPLRRQELRLQSSAREMMITEQMYWILIMAWHRSEEGFSGGVGRRDFAGSC
jgi:hypothetical protein